MVSAYEVRAAELAVERLRETLQLWLDMTKNWYAHVNMSRSEVYSL